MTARLDQGLAADELQGELRDLLCLAVVGDHVRWVLTGDEGAELAEWLADAAPEWRALADRLAKHLVALGVAPDGRVRSLAKDIALNWVPDGWLPPDQARRLVKQRLHGAAARARHRRSVATKVETVQLLDAVSAALETQARSRDDIAQVYSARERVNENSTAYAESLRRRIRRP